ncbi:osmoprotectant transport system permease protein [Motilibacter peucedani]|uniref:Osmoprotectant transport system permease protein n=1 Tax=Motilibacter peucedani TaxID=598650 RepID=A0A420XPS8_9ACTN|nr:ABC transporter permease [Motilibacter peucedani]RKS75269.1 osmoprotectant transport system permease protein [Motilibacter peucedani]
MASSAPNPWLDWGYVRDNRTDILTALEHHVTLTLETVVVATLVSVPLAMLARRFGVLRAPVIGLSGVVYTIPSLALFALLAPYTGIGSRTVLIGLVLYALLILVRNTLAGLDAVPDDVREAARGMGYGPLRVLLRVELPIAMPAVMAGIRLATVSTVALVTVGVVVGYGGLGQLILRGFNNNFYRAEILTNSLLCVALALVLDLLLLGVSRAVTPWARGRS